MTPEEIVDIRKALGISQERLAQLLGSTVTSVNRWENGKATPSRLYVRELKTLKAEHAHYFNRREKSKNA